MKKISERAAQLFELDEEKRDFPHHVRHEALVQALDEWQKSVEDRLSGREVFPPMIGGWK